MAINWTREQTLHELQVLATPQLSYWQSLWVLLLAIPPGRIRLTDLSILSHGSFCQWKSLENANYKLMISEDMCFVCFGRCWNGIIKEKELTKGSGTFFHSQSQSNSLESFNCQFQINGRKCREEKENIKKQSSKKVFKKMPLASIEIWGFKSFCPWPSGILHLWAWLGRIKSSDRSNIGKQQIPDSLVGLSGMATLDTGCICTGSKSQSFNICSGCNALSWILCLHWAFRAFQHMYCLR